VPRRNGTPARQPKKKGRENPVVMPSRAPKVLGGFFGPSGSGMVVIDKKKRGASVGGRGEDRDEDAKVVERLLPDSRR